MKRQIRKAVARATVTIALMTWCEQCQQRAHWQTKTSKKMTRMRQTSTMMRSLARGAADALMESTRRQNPYAQSACDHDAEMAVSNAIAIAKHSTAAVAAAAT
jgi:hypothetical protein